MPEQLSRVEINIRPVAKPRMTQSDKWRERPAVVKYRAFADELRLKVNLADFRLSGSFVVSFFIPVPKSASKREKATLDMTPHLKTPDLDNLLKALNDILSSDNDSHIWSISASKLWTIGPGKIIIQNVDDPT